VQGDPEILAETRRELEGLLGGRTGAIPVELLVDPLLAGHGHAPWPVLREAGNALLRRLAAGEREQLRLARKPEHGAVLGEYRTRRVRAPERPYVTSLISLSDGPHGLWLACDCPDYQLGGLGLCKHGLTVLDALARSPRRLARARGAGRLALTVGWDPIAALDAGDRLAGVLWCAGPRPRGALAEQFAAPNEQGQAAPLARALEPGQRQRFVEQLARACRRGPVDPSLRAVLQLEADELARRRAIVVGKSARAAALRSFGLRLYPYQVTALDRFLATGRLLLADDMGLGKTVQATAIVHTLIAAAKIERVLIIGPASLKGQWVREWRRASEVPIELIEGSPAQRAQLYAATRRGALVANYEQSLRDLELMREFGPDLVILDEAQRIKNWATRTAQAIKRLDVPYRLVLTGTPLENRLDELASIMDWVDPLILAPKWRLGPAHQKLADGGREVIGVQQLDRLRARLAPRMLRRRRAEILSELPERMDTAIAVELTPGQRAEHDALNQPIAALVTRARSRPLTQPEFLRLMSLLTTQRVTANGLAQLQFDSVWPALRRRRCDEATLASLATPKLGHLREIVESLVVEQDRKVVIFSQWRRMLALAGWAIEDLLAAQGKRAAFFTGAESQRRRRQNVIEFHDDPSLAVLLSTDAGGVGLNLQRAASACVHLELPWNPAVFEQRVARVHRLGQPEPVNVYSLISEGSIEERIAGLLGSKQALFSGLFDGDSDEVVFNGNSGFLATVEALCDASSSAGAGTAASVEALDDLDGELVVEPEVEQLVRAADERDDPAPSVERTDAALPAPHEIRELFSELDISARDDGGVDIRASARAARTLGALFAGMAELLDRAGGSAPEDS
jgi:superfamily II DNA or RNA helicase